MDSATHRIVSVNAVFDSYVIRADKKPPRRAAPLFLISYLKVTSRASEVLRVGEISLRFFVESIIACRLP